MKRFFLLFMAVTLSVFVLVGCGSDQSAETITELQATINDLQNQVEEYNALKTELDSANNSIAELQSQLDALTAEKDEMSAKLEALYKIESVDEIMYTIAEANIYDDLYGEALGEEPAGTIPEGEEIKVTGKSVVIDWYVIKTDDSDNLQMVSGSLLSTTKPQPQQPSNTGTSGGSSSGGSSGGSGGSTQPSGGDSQPSGGGSSSSGDGEAHVGDTVNGIVVEDSNDFDWSGTNDDWGVTFE